MERFVRNIVLTNGFSTRHGRACRGHPRLASGASAKKDVDGGNKSGHDARGKGFRRIHAAASWPRLSRPSMPCLQRFREKDVGGRNKSGHDACATLTPP